MIIPEVWKFYDYQRRWIDDDSQYKVAVKARQVGFTFAAAFRVVQKRMRKPGTTLWLSASERQSREAMEAVRKFLDLAKVIAEFDEEVSEFDATVQVQSATLPNGSRIIAVPANPDTIRGFSGDLVLDEFAFHRDADAIWRAAFAITTRGHQLEILSTPNGARGRYYDLANKCGLTNAPLGEGTFQKDAPPWSAHYCDIYSARDEGFELDIESLREAIADEDTWHQEYECRFLATASQYIPEELVIAAEYSTALLNPPDRFEWPVYAGFDIGRHRDLSVLWFLEVENPEQPADRHIYTTRGVRTMKQETFTTQRSVLDSYFAQRNPDGNHLVRVCDIDATGMGMMLAESMTERWGSRAEEVVFTNAVKQALATRVKRVLEDKRLKIPYDPKIRAAFTAIKRVVTAAGNIRFDAERSDSGHADQFWSLALALEAASGPALSTEFHVPGRGLAANEYAGGGSASRAARDF